MARTQVFAGQVNKYQDLFPYLGQIDLTSPSQRSTFIVPRGTKTPILFFLSGLLKRYGVAYSVASDLNTGQITVTFTPPIPSNTEAQLVFVSDFPLGG